MGYDAGLTNLIATQPLRIREANDQSNMTRAQTQGQNISNKVNQMITPYKVQAAQQEVAGNDLDQNKKKLELISNIAYSVVDQPSYEKALNYAKSMGLDTSQFGPQYDKNQIDQVKMGLASATARLGYMGKVQEMNSRAAAGLSGVYVPGVGFITPDDIPAPNGSPGAPAAPGQPSAPSKPVGISVDQPNNGLLNPAAGMQGSDALPVTPVEQRPMTLAPNPGPQAATMQTSSMQQSPDALPAVGQTTQTAPQKPTVEMANQAMAAIVNNQRMSKEGKDLMIKSLQNTPWYAEALKNAEATGTQQAEVAAATDKKANEVAGQEAGDAFKTYNIMSSNLPAVIERFKNMRDAAGKASYGLGVTDEGSGLKQELANNFQGSETAKANNLLMQYAAQGILPELGPQLAQAGVKGNKFLETIANNASGLKMGAPPDVKKSLVDGLENTYINNMKSTARQLRAQGRDAPSDNEIDQMVKKYKSDVLAPKQNNEQLPTFSGPEEPGFSNLPAGAKFIDAETGNQMVKH